MFEKKIIFRIRDFINIVVPEKFTQVNFENRARVTPGFFVVYSLTLVFKCESDWIFDT